MTYFAIHTSLIDPAAGCATVEVGQWPDEDSRLRGELPSSVRKLETQLQVTGPDVMPHLEDMVRGHDWSGSSNGEEFSPDSSGKMVKRPARPSPHHTWNFGAGQWQEPPNLAGIKEDKWQEIKAARSKAEFSTLHWGGSYFDIGFFSQNRLMVAVQMASLDPNFITDWTLADNAVRTMTADDLISLGKALATHISNTHYRARELRAAIDSAKTAAEVRAITWG